jgi:pantoate--beta-alanine ligase
MTNRNQEKIRMRIESSVAGMRAARQAITGSLGLVPTMGALHEGHLSLVRMAKASCEHVAATIFVNPTQFGPNEDFSKYPRTFEKDCALLEREGVDLVFAPGPEEMYPAGSTTRIHVGPLADRLDGASRPGHFIGVATIVAKLFHIVAPDKAFFGQKDAAQVAVLRQMVRDLDLGVELIVGPIVREPDGLAMSSRNRYLSEDERRQALVLSRSLAAAVADYEGGERDAGRLLERSRAIMVTEPAVRLDYLEIVDPATLLPVEQAGTGTLLAVAAYVGSTRLIDNQLF